MNVVLCYVNLSAPSPVGGLALVTQSIVRHGHTFDSPLKSDSPSGRWVFSLESLSWTQGCTDYYILRVRILCLEHLEVASLTDSDVDLYVVVRNVLDSRDYWVFGLRPLSHILQNTKFFGIQDDGRSPKKEE